MLTRIFANVAWMLLMVFPIFLVLFMILRYRSKKLSSAAKPSFITLLYYIFLLIIYFPNTRYTDSTSFTISTREIVYAAVNMILPLVLLFLIYLDYRRIAGSQNRVSQATGEKVNL